MSRRHPHESHEELPPEVAETTEATTEATAEIAADTGQVLGAEVPYQTQPATDAELVAKIKAYLEDKGLSYTPSYEVNQIFNPGSQMSAQFEFAFRQALTEITAEREAATKEAPDAAESAE